MIFFGMAYWASCGFEKLVEGTESGAGGGSHGQEGADLVRVLRMAGEQHAEPSDELCYFRRESAAEGAPVAAGRGRDERGVMHTCITSRAGN